MAITLKSQDGVITAGEEWLQTEPQWGVRLGSEWVGTRILGATDSPTSITGLFELQGPNRQPTTLQQIVVKQVVEDLIDSLGYRAAAAKRETDIYTILNGAKSEHILKMYRPMHMDVSSGTQAPADHPDLFVERLYLEYCPGQTLGDFLETLVLPGSAPLEEQDAWHIFHCLAVACAVLSRGSESLCTNPWSTPVVHLNLQPENLFIAGFNKIDSRLPTFKIGNFQSAFISRTDLPSYQNNAMLYTYAAPWDTITSKGHNATPPEVGHNSTLNAQYPVANQTVGPPANVWGVGTLMYLILTRQRRWLNNIKTCRPLDGPCTYSSKLELAGRALHGSELFQPGHFSVRFYSEKLRTLVLECLLREQEDRPTYNQLQVATQDGLFTSPLPLNSVNYLQFDELRADFLRVGAPIGTLSPSNWDRIDSSYLYFTVALYIFNETTEAYSSTARYLTFQRIYRTLTIAKLKSFISTRLLYPSDGTKSVDVSTMTMRVYNKGVEVSDSAMVRTVWLPSMDMLRVGLCPVWASENDWEQLRWYLEI